MEQKAIQWVGSPSCLRGSYAFYKSVSCRAENGGPPQVWKLGEFYYARCGPQEPVCIAEVTLLWEDLSQRHLLASSRLYFLPEDTPKGRTREHGEDEVLAVSKKVVVRVDDLVKWACVEPAEWKKDPSGTNGLHKPPHNNTICSPSTPKNTTSSPQNNPPEPSTVFSVQDDTSEAPEDQTEISVVVADCPAVQPVSHCAADRPAEQPVSHCAADRPAEQPVSHCAADRPAAQPVSHCAADLPAEQPVSDCAADRPAEQPVCHCAADRPAEQPVSHCAADCPAEHAASLCVADRPAEHAVSLCAADRPAEHAVSLCVAMHPVVACGHMRSHAVIAADRPAAQPVTHCVADRPAEHAVSLCVAALPVVKVLSYPQYCRFRSLQRRIQDGAAGDPGLLHDPHLLALGAIRVALPSTRILFCRDTFSHPSLDNNTSLWAQIRCPPLSLRGRPRKRRGRYSRDSPTSSQSETWIERMKENVLGSVEVNNSEEDDWLPHPEEQLFLEQLYTYMDCHSSPIHKVPNLGFKRINLFLMYSVVKRLGGYDKVTSDRLWKVVYNELGGCAGSTSAATCTRRHYERLILPYEKHLEAGGAELQIPDSLAVPRTRAVGRGRKPMARGRKPRIKAREKSLTPPLPAAAPLSPSLPHPPPLPPMVGASPPDGPMVVVKRGRGRPPGRRNKATLLAQAKLLAQQHAQATKVMSPPPQQHAQATKVMSPPQQHGQATKVMSPPQQHGQATKVMSPPPQQHAQATKVLSPPQQHAQATKVVSPPQQHAQATKVVSPQPTAQTLLVFPPLLAGGRPQQQQQLQQQHIKQLKAPQPQISVCPQTHVVYAGINLNSMPLTPELSPMSALLLPFQPKLGKEPQPQETIGDSLKQQQPPVPGGASPPSALPRHQASSGGSLGGGFSPTKGMCPLDVFRTRLGLHRPPPPPENPDALTPQSSTPRPPAPILHHPHHQHHHPLQTKAGGGLVDTPLPGGDPHHHQCSGCSEDEASQPRGNFREGKSRPPLPPLRVLPLDLDCSVHVRQLMRTRLGSTQLQSFTRRLSEVLSQDLKPAAPLAAPMPPVIIPCSPVTPPPEQAAPLNLSMRTPPLAGAAKRTCSDNGDDDMDPRLSPSTDEPSAKKPRVCPSSEQAEAEDLSLGGRSNSASGRFGGGGGVAIKSQQEEPADLSSPVRLRAFLLGLPPFHIKVEEKDLSEAPSSWEKDLVEAPSSWEKDLSEAPSSWEKDLVEAPSSWEKDLSEAPSSWGKEAPSSWGKPSLLLPHPVPLLLPPPSAGSQRAETKTTEVKDDQNQATVKTEPCLPTAEVEMPLSAGCGGLPTTEVEPSLSEGCGGLGKTEAVPDRVETLKAEDVEGEDEMEAREEETSEPRDAIDQNGDFGEGREELPDDEKMECDVEALTNGLPSAVIPQPTALPLAQKS